MERELQLKDILNITKRSINRQYCPCEAIYVGDIRVVEFGWDYGSTKDPNMKYCVIPILLTFGKNKYNYLTKEEAEKGAYEVVNIFINALSK